MATPSPANASECVKVMVRIRPMNQSETKKGCLSVAEGDKEARQITLKKPKEVKDPPKVFSFDAIFPQDSLQRTIYEESAFPLIESVLEGYNGTIFAYGQTGCGKTFTMVGSKDESAKELRGIIPNAFTHIFENISSFSKEKRFLLRCSYLEIYNENIHDLLEYDDEKKLELKEDPQKGVYIKGLTTVIVRSVQDIEKTMDGGASNRHTAETNMNKDSSRSHCIFSIYIETAETKSDGTENLRAGKLNLVDLAGSERQSKTKAEGMRLKEATKINLSLSALGNVISSLVDGKSSHIPYRDSKLTRLLQDSLGGNTKTVMIACVSPADYNYDETLSTLRYASRAKNIQNKPKINEDPKDALLREYESEIKNLRDMIANLAKGGGIPSDFRGIDDLRKSLQEAGGVKVVEELKKSPPMGSLKVKELEAEKESLNKDKEKIANELKAREEQFLSEKEQRTQLENMLKGLEKKLLFGGQEFEERQKEEKKRYEEMRMKLKKEKMKEKKLREEHQKKEAEKLAVEKQYKDTKEELKDKSDLINELKIKQKTAVNEITDIQHEHQLEKENLLDTIRDQNNELDYYKKFVEIMLSEEELELIKKKSEWDDETKTWKIPTFVVEKKQAPLPNLKQAMGQESAESKKGGKLINPISEANPIFSKTTKQSGNEYSPQEKEYDQSRGEKTIPLNIGNLGAKGLSIDTKKEYIMKVSEIQSPKNMFNWDLLNKGKYVSKDPKKISPADSPAAGQAIATRKNPRLESLPYNPADRLLPIDEEEVKQTRADIEQANAKQAKKQKLLAKIDEAELSAAARYNQINQSDIVSPLSSLKVQSPKSKEAQSLATVGKLKPIYAKRPS